MAFIEFKNVAFHYQTKNERIPIFNNFNFLINEGESIAIYGHSGCGKTSLLNLIAGFLSPTEGEILIDGKNITTLNSSGICEFRNKNIGYIFQFFNLVNELSVYENIALPQIIGETERNKQKDNVFEIATRLGINKRLKHRPFELSGGEQQRVAIARALINNPSIILADEPTGNLDSKSSNNVIDILSEINKSGKTLLIVTHDPKFTEHVDRIINLEDVIVEN